MLSAIDKSERRKPEQTIESLNQAVPEHGERLWDEIEQIKKIDSLEALTERLRSVNTSSDSLTLKWEEMMSLIRAHGAMDYVSIDLSIVRPDWHIIPDLSTKRMKLQEKVSTGRRWKI